MSFGKAQTIPGASLELGCERPSDLQHPKGPVSSFWFASLVSVSGLAGHGYIQDVPLEAPKIEMAKKWYFDGFGPSQLTCPKSGQKVPEKWSANGLSKIWGQKNAKKMSQK